MGSETLLILLLAAVVLIVTVIGTYWLFVAFSSLRGQIANMQLSHHDLSSEVERLRIDLAIEREYVRVLARAFREATGKEPPPREPNGGQIEYGKSDLAGLAHKVAACYSLEELATLAMELGLADVLTGETLENRASSLVLAAQRRGILSELVAIARRDRPRGGF